MARLKLYVPFFIIFISSSLFSQSKQEIKKLSEYMSERKEISERQRKEIIPLENFIDVSAYHIGPGDVLYIDIWSEMDRSHEVQVLPDGNVLIPAIGDVNVTGLTLEETKEIIKNRIREFYPKSNITVSLADLRKFKVFIEGEINFPGSYIVNPVIRVSDLIETAGNVTEWANKQNIIIRHSQEGTTSFNLLEFENKGNLDINPFLKDGDFVFVPRIRFSEGVIHVSGDSSISGFYRFYEDEVLTDFLKRISVGRRSTDWKHSYLRRTNPDTTFSLNMVGKDGSIIENLELKTNDFIYIPPIVNRVYVIGAVKSPGSYYFLPNMKARDYLGMAGRTENGSDRVKIRRRSTGEVVKGLDILVERGDIVIVPQKWYLTLRDFMESILPATSLIIAAKAIGIIK